MSGLLPDAAMRTIQGQGFDLCGLLAVAFPDSAEGEGGTVSEATPRIETNDGTNVLIINGKLSRETTARHIVKVLDAHDSLVEALEGYADARQLARSFHELYEALAPEFSYETRKESAVHWDDIPDNTRALMVAVALRIADKARAALEEAKR